jgi:glycosyltransferase involved in cell wall biosynthesis
MRDMASLTIGMPLYNNAETLIRALDSLRNQTFKDFVVIMSDDVSPDNTASIAADYCLQDDRFVLVRQKRNLNYGNFRYVLGQARTEYFMFAAGDDTWEPTFAESCIAALKNDPKAVCAVSQVRFLDDSGSAAMADGTRPLLGTAAENICSYFQDHPGDNSRMYGVFRTAVAQDAFPPGDHHAWDYTFSAGTLLHGTHLELPQCLMHRTKTPFHKYVEYVRRDGKGLWRIFPLLGMTTSLLRRRTVRKLPGVVKAILAANLSHHMEYMKRFHPRWCRLSMPIVQRIYWRLL